jgi:hypothetical protein
MLNFLDFFGVVTYVMLGYIVDDVALVGGFNLELAFVYSSQPKS